MAGQVAAAARFECLFFKPKLGSRDKPEDDGGQGFAEPPLALCANPRLSRGMKTVEFWFDPASTYSYLAAVRIDAVAAHYPGVEVVWQPFLLGPIFKAQGLDNSPFRIYPAKGRHMWRDMERQAKRLEIPLRVPDDAAMAGFPAQQPAGGADSNRRAGAPLGP